MTLLNYLRANGVGPEQIDALADVYLAQRNSGDGSQLLYIKRDEDTIVKMIRELAPITTTGAQQYEELRKKAVELLRRHVVLEGMANCNFAPQPPVRDCGSLLPENVYLSRNVTTAVVDADVIVSDEGKPARRANVADEFIRQFPVVKRGDSLFVYHSNHWQLVTPDELISIVAAFCFNEVKRADSAIYAEQVVRLVLVDPRISNRHDYATDGNLVFTQDGRAFDILAWRFVDLGPMPFFSSYLRISSSDFSTETLRTPALESLLAAQYAGLPQIQRDAAELAVWQILGMLFSNDCSRRVITVLQGASGSGKSTIEKLLEFALPEHATSAIRLNDFGTRFAMAESGDKKILFVPDMPSRVFSSSEADIMKILSGHDRFTSDVKFRGRKRIDFHGKVVLITNHPVLLPSRDDAFFARLRCVPFFNTVLNQDSGYVDRLKAELPAIIIRSLGAYAQMLKSGEEFACPFQVNSCLRLESEAEPDDFDDDVVAMFIADEVLPATEESFVATREIREAFLRYIREHGLINQVNFDLENKLAFAHILAQKMTAIAPFAVNTKQRLPKGKAVNGYVKIRLKGENLK